MVLQHRGLQTLVTYRASESNGYSYDQGPKDERVVHWFLIPIRSLPAVIVERRNDNGNQIQNQEIQGMSVWTFAGYPAPPASSLPARSAWPYFVVAPELSIGLSAHRAHLSLARLRVGRSPRALISTRLSRPKPVQQRLLSKHLQATSFPQKNTA